MELVEEKKYKRPHKGCSRPGKAATVSNLIIEGFATADTPNTKKKK